ncbi:unnamed protein product [Caenorhabditis angaria]|uniref:LITAF domain-containing protein n=1 Tax=Caenorhabditis angaria TaxID=860376 RepID=A0A9P1IHA7_9PELO|nr:unnamed protein product [Caenorhabditis angaria]
MTEASVELGKINEKPESKSKPNEEPQTRNIDKYLRFYCEKCEKMSPIKKIYIFGPLSITLLILGLFLIIPFLIVLFVPQVRKIQYCCYRCNNKSDRRILKKP